jgi:pimeloyl-ACP methyl ester carboxylesterase
MTRSGVRSPSRAVRRFRALLVVAGLAVALVAAVDLVFGLPETVALPPSTRTVPRPLAECTSTDGRTCEGLITLQSGWKIPYYQNYPLVDNTTAIHAVIVVHGTERNAESYFSGMLAAASGAKASTDTLILAPNFQAPDDDPDHKDARWEDEGWKVGDNSLRPEGLSSFAVMDQVLNELADKNAFPKLARITLVGHSAGGQYVQRYAALGRAPAASTGVEVDYVVANPSSYLYFNRYRPDPTDPTGRRFMVPQTSCRYNDYKYGLDNRNEYAAQLTAEAIIAQYIGRRVTYLLGQDDREDNHSLDTECEAQVQGANRYVRGISYYNYIQAYFPTTTHHLVTVPGVGHDHDAMFASPQGVSVLFGAG